MVNQTIPILTSTWPQALFLSGKACCWAIPFGETPGGSKTGFSIDPCTQSEGILTDNFFLEYPFPQTGDAPAWIVFSPSYFFLQMRLLLPQGRWNTKLIFLDIGFHVMPFPLSISYIFLILCMSSNFKLYSEYNIEQILNSIMVLQRVLVLLLFYGFCRFLLFYCFCWGGYCFNLADI